MRSQILISCIRRAVSDPREGTQEHDAIKWPCCILVCFHHAMLSGSSAMMNRPSGQQARPVIPILLSPCLWSPSPKAGFTVCGPYRGAVNGCPKRFILTPAEASRRPLPPTGLDFRGFWPSWVSLEAALWPPLQSRGTPRPERACFINYLTVEGLFCQIKMKSWGFRPQNPISQSLLEK